MKSFTLRSQFNIPTHSNLITNKNSSQFTKTTPPRIKPLNKPMFLNLKKLKLTPKFKNSSSINKVSKDEELDTFDLSTKVENSRYVIVGAVSVGLMMLLMSCDDHQKALAFGPEGPLMEDFWDNMRRYGLYALTVSSGVLYAIFQPLYELLKNPISAILVITILGGGFYIVSQVVSAMVGITEFSYQYTY